MAKDGSDKKVNENGQPTNGSATDSLLNIAQQAYEITDGDLAVRKAYEIIQSLYLPSELSEKERNVRVTRAIELFEGLAPQNGIEEMLALQMVATHSAAMECLRRAMIAGQFVQPLDKYISNAQKLLTLYTRQLEALNKQRGKAEQKVTVEYVDRSNPARPLTTSAKAKAARAERRWEPKVIASEEGAETSATSQPLELQTIVELRFHTIASGCEDRQSASIAKIFHVEATLLRKSADGRTSPIPGETYPTALVTGMPSAV